MAMTIDKAIELIDIMLVNFDPDFEEDEKDACQLGIEALKYHLARRQTVDAVGSPLLPGETEE